VKSQNNLWWYNHIFPHNIQVIPLGGDEKGVYINSCSLLAGKNGKHNIRNHEKIDVPVKSR
jgi:hypothetical protein